VYEVAIDAEACVVQCEILDLVMSQGNPGALYSDWDAQGYREMEFRIVSGNAYDEHGAATDLGRNGCAALAERYGEFIEGEIWRQLDVERDVI
jgi:hypothetical protein